MYTIKTMNAISGIIKEAMPEERYHIAMDAAPADAYLVRSADLHSTAFEDSLLAIGRAGAGTNNIPIDTCTSKGIVVFNTPGANANAVKELIIAALLLASRKIVDGIAWAQSLKGKGADVPKLVEKGKSQFVGPEILGKTLGVVGLGAIGGLVANSASSLGMKVIGYDPFISVESAWSLSRRIIRCNDLTELLSQCDYVTLHLPLLEQTKGMFDADTLASMKQGAALLNFSRGELVDNDALLAALESGHLRCYVTDFPNDQILGQPGVIPIPHLGASTPESEENCAAMVSQQIRDFLEHGDIVHSVNFPDVTLPRTAGYRITAIHQNIPNMISQLTGVVAAAHINIENMINKSRGDIGYTVLDLDEQPEESVLEAIRSVDGIIRVRAIGRL